MQRGEAKYPNQFTKCSKLRCTPNYSGLMRLGIDYDSQNFPSLMYLVTKGEYIGKVLKIRISRDHIVLKTDPNQ